MVQFCNVNSCQSLTYIFYKDHFLASKVRKLASNLSLLVKNETKQKLEPENKTPEKTKQTTANRG